jgi:hypothetical protein
LFPACCGENAAAAARDRADILACEANELAGAGDDGAPLGCAGDGDAAATPELDALVS